MNKKEYFSAPGLLFCAGEASCTVVLFGRELEVRLISAYETALCLKNAKKLEKKLLADEVGNSSELAKSACLCASCLYDGLGRVFETGEEALLRLTAEELAVITESYAKLRSEDFDVYTFEAEDIDLLKSGLCKSALERIRWKVLRSLGRLPCETAVREMTDGQYLYCYVNLLLDRELSGQEREINESFGHADGDAGE